MSQQSMSNLSVHPEKTTIQKDTCTPVFTATLFTIERHGSNINVL